MSKSGRARVVGVYKVPNVPFVTFILEWMSYLVYYDASQQM